MKTQLDRIEDLLIVLLKAHGLDVEKLIEEVEYQRTVELLNRSSRTTNAIGGPQTGRGVRP